MIGSNNTWESAFRDDKFAAIAIADWFIGHFFQVGVLGIAAAAWAAGYTNFERGLRILALGLLLAAASSVSGWLLGLLFGVPRTLARAREGVAVNERTAADSSPNGRRAEPTSRVNTNLEDISDWLTKTLVGVGLTQFYSAPHFFWVAAGRINDRGFVWEPHGQLLALSLFFYFAPGGFWLGYVGTRTILTRLFGIFDNIEGPSERSVTLSGAPQNLRVDTAGAVASPVKDDQLARADLELMLKPFQTLRSSTEMAAWGAAHARAGRLAEAEVGLRAALQLDPDNASIKEQLAKIYIALGRRADAATLLRGTPETELTVFNALYEPPPGGFLKAIEIGERLLSGEHPGANLHVWLSSAYGQQFEWERDHGADPARLEGIAEKALREAQAAVAQSPVTRSVLRSMWKPAPGAIDDDLAALADHEGFRKLLDPELPKTQEMPKPTEPEKPAEPPMTLEPPKL